MPPRPTRSGKPLRSAGMFTESFRLRSGGREETEKRIKPTGSAGLPNPSKKWKYESAALSVPWGFQSLICTPVREQVSQVVWTQIAEGFEHYPWRMHPEGQKRPDAPSELSQTGQPCECKMVSWLSNVSVCRQELHAINFFRSCPAQLGCHSSEYGSFTELSNM